MTDRIVVREKDFTQLSAAELRKLRPYFLELLRRSGAEVMCKEIRGHLVAVVIPGESDPVATGDASPLFQEIATELEIIADALRNADRQQLATEKARLC